MTDQGIKKEEPPDLEIGKLADGVVLIFFIGFFIAAMMGWSGGASLRCLGEAE